MNEFFWFIEALNIKANWAEYVRKETALPNFYRDIANYTSFYNETLIQNKSAAFRKRMKQTYAEFKSAIEQMNSFHQKTVPLLP